MNERKRQVENQAKILSINYCINWPDDWDLRSSDPPRILQKLNKRYSRRKSPETEVSNFPLLLFFFENNILNLYLD